MNNKTRALSNGTWVCHAQKGSRSKGFFFGDNPLNFPTTILYVQLSISALLTSFLQLILNPLGESTFTSQMLVRSYPIYISKSIFWFFFHFKVRDTNWEWENGGTTIFPSTNLQYLVDFRYLVWYFKISTYQMSI